MMETTTPKSHRKSESANDDGEKLDEWLSSVLAPAWLRCRQDRSGINKDTGRVSGNSAEVLSPPRQRN